MIRGVLHHVAERIFPPLTFEILVPQPLFQTFVGESLDEVLLRAFDRLPASFNGSNIGKLFRREDLLW